MSAVIAETRSWDIGPYRVQQRPRPDNQAWPAYIVFRGERLVGKSFSLPDLDCCKFLERNGVYATKDQNAPLQTYRDRQNLHRRGRRVPGT